AVREAALLREPSAALRRRDRSPQRPAPGQLPSGLLAPRVDQRRDARDPGGARHHEQVQRGDAHAVANPQMAHFIEVSHPVVEGMKTYPGLPEPRAEIVFDYDQSHE